MINFPLDGSTNLARFFKLGMQIVSCSGDGLLKLWTVKTSECVATFDAHEGKIWALDGNKKKIKIN